MKKGNSNSSQSNKYSLDSFAVIAFFQEEKGSTIVKNLFKKAQKKECELFLSIVNLGEVMYTFIKDYGEKETIELMEEIEDLPITILSINQNSIWEAAKIKAKGGVSYADAFVIATALIHNAIVVTGDKEFKKFEKMVKIEWLLTKSK